MVMSKIPRPDIVWVDVETTGLSYEHDLLLEIVILLSDRKCNVIDYNTWLVGEPSWNDRVQDAKLDEFVGPMHKESGLWMEWEQALEVNPKLIHPRIVQDQILNWFDEHELAYGQYPMAGSSVGFDRHMMGIHLPDVEQHFHYRNLDISSHKESCKLNNPHVYEQRPENPDPIHRPLPDIKDSITEYRYYMENYLWVDFGDEE